MNYEGQIYRPPSEAYSLILQVSIGCAHNTCSFCGMYKDKIFRIRNVSEVLEDLHHARKVHRHVEKIFLADGNALALPFSDLEKILLEIQRLFPECKRVSAYSAPKDLLRKGRKELVELYALGLKMLYLGVESGNAGILEWVNKGVNPAEIIVAGQKAKDAGFKLSVTVISGLGGKERQTEHALDSAKVINVIQPDYFALLTLLVQPGTGLHQEIEEGRFRLLTPGEVLAETHQMISALELKDTLFRSNHPSNYLPLEGTLSKDKRTILTLLEKALRDPDKYHREEHHRRL